MGRRLRSRGAGFISDGGIPVVLEESHALPVVDLELGFRTGSFADPEGKGGLARIFARMVRMGTRRLRGVEVEERVARLGARLSIELSGYATRFRGTVLRRNLDPFIALLGELLTEPAFRNDDLEHAKREALGDLVGIRDNDEALAALSLDGLLFEGHPYGRSALGTPASIRRISRKDLVERHRDLCVRGNMVVGVAGDVTADDLAPLVDEHLSSFDRRSPVRSSIPAPRIPKGRRIRIIDKPARTQTQIFVGTRSGRLGDESMIPLHVGNTAFGGMFTGKLMHEVRAVRGLSYGAGSRLDAQRRVFSIHTFPSVGSAVECTELVLSLFEDFVDRGLTDSEVRDAKRYLTRGHCFEVDTASKRLDARMEVELYRLSPELYSDYERLVRKVKPAEVRESIRRRLSTKHLGIAIVAGRKEVEAQLRSLPGVTDVQVVPYDRL